MARSAGKTSTARKESTQNDDKRAKALEAALQQIEKNYGKGSIMRLSDERIVPVEGISTGPLSLDIALGGKGMPRGRVCELFGPEGGGKTTLALHVIANAQKDNGVAAFIDAEHALDPAWARKVGVQVDNLLISQPESGEESL